MNDLIAMTQKVVDSGKLVLLMGVIPRNLDSLREIADRKTLEIWPIDTKYHSVPANTGLVLRTQFVNHKIVEQLRRNLPNGTIFHPKSLESREIKALIRAVWGDPKKSNGSKLRSAATVTAMPVEMKEEVPMTASVVSSAPVEDPKSSLLSPAELLGSFSKELSEVQAAIALLLEENATLQGKTGELHTLVNQLEEEIQRAERRESVLREKLSIAEKRAGEAEQGLKEAGSRADAAERKLAEQALAAQKLLEVFRK